MKNFACPYDNEECTGLDTSGMNQIVPCDQCRRYNFGIRPTGALPKVGIKKMFQLWLAKKKLQYQFINWGQWVGFIFVKGDPVKEPAAFHLIYKWGVYLGWFEVRKFLTDKEMEKALKIYNSKPL